MADNDNDDANVTPLHKDLLKAIQAITSFDPTGSPSANRKSLEDKLIKLAVTLQMFQFTSKQIRPLTRLREEGFHQMVAEELGPVETDHNRLMREYMRIALQHILGESLNFYRLQLINGTKDVATVFSEIVNLYGSNPDNGSEAMGRMDRLTYNQYCLAATLMVKFNECGLEYEQATGQKMPRAYERRCMEKALSASMGNASPELAALDNIFANTPPETPVADIWKKVIQYEQTAIQRCAERNEEWRVPNKFANMAPAQLQPGSAIGPCTTCNGTGLIPFSSSPNQDQRYRKPKPKFEKKNAQNGKLYCEYHKRCNHVTKDCRFLAKQRGEAKVNCQEDQPSNDVHHLPPEFQRDDAEIAHSATMAPTLGFTEPAAIALTPSNNSISFVINAKPLRWRPWERKKKQRRQMFPCASPSARLSPREREYWSNYHRTVQEMLGNGTNSSNTSAMAATFRFPHQSQFVLDGMSLGLSEFHLSEPEDQEDEPPRISEDVMGSDLNQALTTSSPFETMKLIQCHDTPLSIEHFVSQPSTALQQYANSDSHAMPIAVSPRPVPELHKTALELKAAASQVQPQYKYRIDGEDMISDGSDDVVVNDVDMLSVTVDAPSGGVDAPEVTTTLQISRGLDELICWLEYAVGSLERQASVCESFRSLYDLQNCRFTDVERVLSLWNWPALTKNRFVRNWERLADWGRIRDRFVEVRESDVVPSLHPLLIQELRAEVQAKIESGHHGRNYDVVTRGVKSPLLMHLEDHVLATDLFKDNTFINVASIKHFRVMIGTQLDKVFGCQHWDVEHQAGLLRAQVTRLSPEVAELVYTSDNEARSESSINSQSSPDLDSTSASSTMVRSSMAPMNDQPLGTSVENEILHLESSQAIVFGSESSRLPPVRQFLEPGTHIITGSGVLSSRHYHTSSGLHLSPADEAALLELDDIVVASRHEDVLVERRRSLRPSAGLLSQNSEDATRPSSSSIADFGVRSPDFR